MANTAGQMFFSVISPLLVTAPADLFKVMLWPQLAPGVVLTTLLFFLLRSRPPIAPSASAAKQAEQDDEAHPGFVMTVSRLYTSLLSLLSNPNFVRLIAACAMPYSICLAVLVLEQQLVSPCGYSDATAGAAGTVQVGCGLAAALGLGYVMEATRAYARIQVNIDTTFFEINYLI